MRNINRQYGSAMLVTLVCLTVLTIIGLFAVKASSARLRSSMNEANHIHAIQSAQTMLNGIFSDKRDYLDTFAPEDSTEDFCIQSQAGDIPNIATRNCLIGGEADITPWRGQGLIYSERLNSGNGYLPEGLGLSQNNFTSIQYGIHVIYVPTENTNLGYAQIEQGVLRLQIAPQNQTSWQNMTDLYVGR